MKPFIKYCGGKTALLPEILPRIPAKIGTYYEPFLGGGAVFFALADEDRFERAVLADTNEELMRTYAALCRYPNEVVLALKKHVYEERYYYKVRARDPKALDAVACAARFLYLNRTGFNGLYRVNRKGEFNVPFGKYTNPTICDEQRLRDASAALKRTTALAKTDFDKTVADAKRGDFVYFDPPYAPVSATANFTAYSKEGFDGEAQWRLKNTAKHLIADGVNVLLSNSDTPLVRELYKGFHIERVSAPRRINSNGAKRGNVGELLISGKTK